MINKLSPTLLALLLVSGACGKDDSGGDDKTGAPSTGAAGEIEDTSEAGIVAFVKQGAYQEWSARQAAPIDSVSAHSGKTLTYFNDTAATAARAGQNPLPRGSVLVKDLYTSDGVTLRGHAAMAKVEDGTGGGTWVWFEGFLPDFAEPYYGKGLGTCTGCHGSGTDFVRTTVP